MANPMVHFVLWLCIWPYVPNGLDCINYPKLYLIKIDIVDILHGFIYWHMVFGTLLFETCKATSKYMNNDICVVCQYALTFGAQCSGAYKAQIFIKKFDVVKYFLIGIEFICL